MKEMEKITDLYTRATGLKAECTSYKPIFKALETQFFKNMPLNDPELCEKGLNEAIPLIKTLYGDISTKKSGKFGLDAIQVFYTLAGVWRHCQMKKNATLSFDLSFFMPNA